MIHALSLRNRADLHAVSTILKQRHSLPEAERVNVVMHDEGGKTVLGAVYWNLGTIVQDYPALVALTILAGGLAIVWELVQAVIALA
jgi:hypothetical protein